MDKTPRGQASHLQREFEDDFEHMVRSLSGEVVKPRDIVVTGSAFLRKWITERGLEKLAHENGYDIHVRVHDNRKHVRLIDEIDDFSFYTTACVGLEGHFCGPFYHHKHAPPPDRPWMEFPPRQFVRLRDFKRRRVTHYDGTWFKNENIIRFAANKYGGVHLDRRDTLDEADRKYLEATEYASWGGPDEVDTTSNSGLRYIVTSERIEPYNCCHIELLSMCESIATIRFNGQQFAVFDLDTQQAIEAQPTGRPRYVDLTDVKPHPDGLTIVRSKLFETDS